MNSLWSNSPWSPDLIPPGMFIIIACLGLLSLYITGAVGYFLVYRKAGARHSWWAFIPVLATIPLLDAVRMRRWWAMIYLAFPVSLILMFIALASNDPMQGWDWLALLLVLGLLMFFATFFALAAFRFYWTLRLYRAFGVHWAFALFHFGVFIPGVGGMAPIGLTVVAFWIGVSKDIVYQPTESPKGGAALATMDA